MRRLWHEHAGNVKCPNAQYVDSADSGKQAIDYIFSDRILEFGVEEARIWGRLSAEIDHSGVDLMIAATAIKHEATMVTRNLPHFRSDGRSHREPVLSDLLSYTSLTTDGSSPEMMNADRPIFRNVWRRRLNDGARVSWYQQLGSPTRLFCLAPA